MIDVVYTAPTGIAETPMPTPTPTAEVVASSLDLIGLSVEAARAIEEEGRAISRGIAGC